MGRNKEVKNGLIELQELLIKQAHRLDEAVASEVRVEIGRSGGMSQNAQAYCKAVSLSLQIKQMNKKNPAAEETILKELGVLRNEN